MNRRTISVMIALTVLAVLATGSRLGWRQPEPPRTPSENATEPQKTDRFVQIGHDWVVPLSSDFDPTVTTIAKSLRLQGARHQMASCTTVGCRTCQWFREFGGEW